MAETPARKFVSRAGAKLGHALDAFCVDVAGVHCADFGCNVGGFTDCLLKRGAARVYAIDTGYNVLDYSLRRDPRVVVMERTNALHVDPPEEDAAGVDLVVIDLAWTPQRHAIPAALRWLKDDPAARIVTLIKPHYELDEAEKRDLLKDGTLAADHAKRVLKRALGQMRDCGAIPIAWTRSPITGGKSGRKSSKATKRDVPSGEVGPGNVEYLALIGRAIAPHQPMD